MTTTKPKPKIYAVRYNDFLGDEFIQAEELSNSEIIDKGLITKRLTYMTEVIWIQEWVAFMS